MFELVRVLATASLFELVAQLASVIPTDQVLRQVLLASGRMLGKRPTAVPARQEEWGLLARWPLDSRNECRRRKDRRGPIRARCSAPEGASQQSDLLRSV
jgi:hypothetical protein